MVLRTDWSKRWPDAKAMRSEDDKKVAHYPGWSLAVLKHLYEKRQITWPPAKETRADRYGPWPGDEPGRLLPGNLHPEAETTTRLSC